MPNKRRFAVITVIFWLLLVAHAVLTWSIKATIALFGGGAIIAFIGEFVVVRLGWLKHHIGPRVAGVPLYALFGFTGIVYALYRIVLMVTTGWTAVGVAAILATTYNMLVDHRGVAAGYWEYSYDLPGPRLREVPWWNFLGWFVLSFLMTVITQPFL